MSALLKSSLAYLPGILVPRLFSYIIVIIFTRLLAPLEFGVYTLVITYGEVLDSVFMNWFRLGMLRFLQVNSKEEKGSLISVSIYFYFGAFFVVSLILLSSIGFFGASSSFCIALLVYFTGNSTMRLALTVLRADENYKLYASLEILRPILSFIGIFLLVPVAGFSYFSLVFGFFGVTSIFGTGTLIWVVKKYFRTPADWQMMRQIIQYALPLVLLFFLTSTIWATDRYMLNSLAGTDMVGLYAASSSLARPAVEILFNAINLGAFPRLIKVYEKEGDQAAVMHLSEIATVLLYWGIPMVVGIAALAEPLSSLLLGEEYRKTATLLMPLMALTGLLNGVRCYVFDQVFHLKKASMMHSYILAPASFINIILNFFFIPIYGTTGAACATLFSFLFALCASIFFSRKILSVSLSVKEIRIIIFSSFTMWCFLFFFIKNTVPIFLLFSIPSGCAVYFLCSKYLGSKVTKNIEMQIFNYTGLFR